MNDQELLDIMISAALEAGRAAHDIFRGDLQLAHKKDDSPVTAADHAAEAIILQRLGAFRADIPIIAEEQVPEAHAVRATASQHQVAPGAYAPIRVRPAPSAGLTVVGSRSHPSPKTDAYLEGYSVAAMVSIGSSLKFCLVASGEADLYPRLGTTMEWDTAAGHAVLLAAGGSVVSADGTPLCYGKAGFTNPWFIATGSVAALPIAP